MKQIFEWLREQIKGLSNAEADYYYANSNDVIDREDTLDLINEAEAKWEADCCEWKFMRNCSWESSCECCYDYAGHNLAGLGYNYCPKCRKPIKIVEVE